MGTNYYLKVNECPHCKRHDEEHIGKQSYGWAFIFRDTFPNKKEWEKAINAKGVKIKDEYGYPVGKKKFWKMVEDNKEKLNLFTYEGRDPRDAPDEYEYFDKEGYRFGKREFC